MPIPTTGSVSLTNTVQTEFGGEVPTSMSEYYKTGGNVPDTALNTLIPTSGAITLGNFRGGSKSTFSILPNSTNINEGDTVTFTVNTTDYGSGTLYWTLSTISGTITNADFSSPSNVLSGGSVSITNNVGNINLTLANDANTDGIDSFQILLRVTSVSGTIVATSSTVTVADTSLTQTFALSRSDSSVTEGNSVIITLTTTNVPNGTTIPYTITGISQSDLSLGSLTGNFTVNNNTASENFTFVQESSSDYLYIRAIPNASSSSAIRRYDRPALISNLGSPNITNTGLGLNTAYYDFHPQGTMYFQYQGNFSLSRYNLSTAFDISAASAGTSPAQTRTINTPTTKSMGGATISPNGLRYIVYNNSDQYIYSYSFLASTPYAVDTLATGWGQRILVGTGSTLSYPDSVRPTSASGLQISPAGKLYLLNAGTLWQYSISTTSYAVSTLVYQKRFTIPSPTANSFAFSTDGTTLYTTSFQSNVRTLRQYTLSTPWEVDTASLTSSLQTSQTFFDQPKIGKSVEGNETFVLSLNNGASSVAVTVVDA